MHGTKGAGMFESPPHTVTALEGDSTKCPLDGTKLCDMFSILTETWDFPLFAERYADATSDDYGLKALSR